MGHRFRDENRAPVYSAESVDCAPRNVQGEIKTIPIRGDQVLHSTPRESRASRDTAARNYRDAFRTTMFARKARDDKTAGV